MGRMSFAAVTETSQRTTGGNLSGATEQLVAAAQAVDANTHLIVIVLLGGDAGLRCGEMMALEWSDVNLRTRQLRISRSEWRGQVTATKGGKCGMSR